MSLFDWMPVTKRYLTEIVEIIMAQLSDLENAIANEQREVRAKLDILMGEIQALKDQLGTGVHITQEQLQKLITDTDNILPPDQPPTP